MKKSDICGLVAEMMVALPTCLAVAECNELIMDKIDKKYGDDLKENHKIARSLIKTGLFCSEVYIGYAVSQTVGYMPGKVIGTLIFKD